MTPDAEAFKGGEIKVKEEEQNLAVTPESIPSSSMESNTTFSSDDDDEEECYSSASATSSSLPSPEIFRNENYGVCAFLYSHNQNIRLFYHSFIISSLDSGNIDFPH